MPILDFLIHLAGATMLLLFAVRMVRTGIERSYGGHFQAVMTRHNTPLTSVGVGIGMAIVLQSSAAVALLSAGFAGTGALSFGAGLAIVLGGDLGSALVVRLLSFQLDWLVPVLLSAGGWLFIKSQTRKWRQLGRILMGIAFILIALQFLRAAMDPIRDSAFLPAIAEYLTHDFITAFIVGGVLAFVMHSSVAAILMCVTLVQIGALPFEAGLSLLLGANLGGALIPIWLARRMNAAARRIPLANLIVRGGWAITALLAINLSPTTDLLTTYGRGPALIYAHITFNAALLLIALPLLTPLDRLTRSLLPDDLTAQNGTQPVAQSALDPGDVNTPTLALANLKREVLRMSGLVEDMFAPILDLYDSDDPDRIKALRTADAEVNACLSGIRDYTASLPRDTYTKAEKRGAREMVDYAISLESAGDVIAHRFTKLAKELHQTGARFSPEGWQELGALHASITNNMRLASNVLISDDLESARLLNLEKEEVKRAERHSRKRHVKRLQKGSKDSAETSDIHLETLVALREFNRHISAVAHPILMQNGQLLETRLIDALPASG